jgi:uncharacterized membrane protein
MPPKTRRQVTLRSIAQQLSIVIENQETMLHNLQSVIRHGRRQIMVNDRIEKALSDLNQATNDVAAELEQLKQQIQGGISSDEAETIAARLDAASEKLRAMAADPNNPVPE